MLSEIVEEFCAHGIRTSIFIGTDLKDVENAAKLGADRVELYTEPYATNYAKDPAAAVQPFVEAATFARKNGLGVNAGHDLSLENLAYLHTHIPWLEEVSIGHALITDALYLGLKKTIQSYKNCLK
jgi:pyridoxine 5-phosphate synthase